jgi:hypothetical protein
MPIKRKKNVAPNDQHLWKEIFVQPELLCQVCELEDLNEEEKSVIKEAKIVVQQKLYDRVMELVSKHFTEHQELVLALMSAPSRTYNEAATILDINYTAISHAIKGIKSQKHGGKFHGGYENKLKKICMKDSQCQKYIEYVCILRENDPNRALEILRELDKDWNNFKFTKADL